MLRRLRLVLRHGDDEFDFDRMLFVWKRVLLLNVVSFHQLVYSIDVRIQILNCCEVDLLGRIGKALLPGHVRVALQNEGLDQSFQ